MRCRRGYAITRPPWRSANHPKSPGGSGRLTTAIKRLTAVRYQLVVDSYWHREQTVARRHSTAKLLQLRQRQRALRSGALWQDSVAIDGQPHAWVCQRQARTPLRSFERFPARSINPNLRAFFWACSAVLRGEFDDARPGGRDIQKKPTGIRSAKGSGFSEGHART
jgi:hypothetical protein